MKYNKKPEIIEAIEFKYTAADMAKLRDFCGVCLLRSGPQRTPTEGPWAYIKICVNCHEIIIVMEDTMVIKHANGRFSSMEKSKFDQQYDLIPE